MTELKGGGAPSGVYASGAWTLFFGIVTSAQVKKLWLDNWRIRTFEHMSSIPDSVCILRNYFSNTFFRFRNIFCLLFTFNKTRNLRLTVKINISVILSSDDQPIMREMYLKFDNIAYCQEVMISCGKFVGNEFHFVIKWICFWWFLVNRLYAPFSEFFIAFNLKE